MINEVGEPYSLQRCNNRRTSRRKLSTFAFLAAALILCECQGSSFKKELSINSCSALANNNGNHTTPSVTTERKKKPLKSQSSSQRQGILRIQREWKDAVKAGIAFDWTKREPRGKAASTSHLWIGPLGTSLLTWHFSLTGVPGSAFENGIYHGRIVLPPDYPSTPPRIMMLTPSGRFIPGHDICLSASNYHPETWQPNAWSLRTLVESLRLHMCTAANEIGGLNDSYEDRRMYAQQSRQWGCTIQHKSQSIWIDHGTMLERGFFPNEGDVATGSDEREIAMDSDERESTKGGGDFSMGSEAMDTFGNVKYFMREEADDVSFVYEYRPKRKGSKRKSLKAKSKETFVQVIRQTLTSPLRMSVLTFVLLFFYLNL